MAAFGYLCFHDWYLVMFPECVAKGSGVGFWGWGGVRGAFIKRSPALAHRW